MANHLDYLEETGMTASEWEKATNAAAQERLDASQNAAEIAWLLANTKPVEGA